MGRLSERKYGTITIDKPTQRDEPGFLLRGQDKLAPLVLDFYADLLDTVAISLDEAKRGGDEYLTQAARVRLQASDMRAWQQTNNTKLPD